MTLPPTRQDDSRPVVLEEPARELAPQWNKDFALRPEEVPTVDLQAAWAAVLAPGETPLWQGQPSPDLRAAPLQQLMSRPFLLAGIAAFVLIVLLNAGVDPGILPIILVFLFLGLRKGLRSTKGNADPDRRYLLTNRAAYLARAQGADLFDIQAFPITPTMRLAQGPRAVAFTTRRTAKGKEEAEGFLDIEDAATVHAMIREVQQGRDMGQADQWGGDGAR